MHRPLLLLATTLLVAASIAVTAVSATLTPLSNPNAPADARSIATVRRYYDAVNSMIATGDPGLLRDIISNELIEIDPPLAGREDIEDYAAYLHRALPDTRLKAGPVTAHGAQVIARVTVQRNSDALPLGFMEDGLSVLWPSSEMFLVSEEQIIQREFRWDGLVTIEPVDGFAAGARIPGAHTSPITLNQFESGEEAGFTTRDTPAIHRIVSGNLQFDLSRWAPESALVLQVSPDAVGQIPQQVLPGQSRDLGPGDVLVVPPNSAYALRNPWPVPASAVHMAVAAFAEPATDMDTSFIYDDFRVSNQLLLTLPIDDVNSSAQLGLGIATMMPGSRLMIDPATRLLVLWTETGELVTTASRIACSETGVASSPQPDDEQLLAGLHLLCPATTGQTAGVLNPGNAPATALIIAVTSKPLKN
jgi:hypothetical protein